MFCLRFSLMDFFGPFGIMQVLLVLFMAFYFERSIGLTLEANLVGHLALFLEVVAAVVSQTPFVVTITACFEPLLTPSSRSSLLFGQIEEIGKLSLKAFQTRQTLFIVTCFLSSNFKLLMQQHQNPEKKQQQQLL